MMIAGVAPADVVNLCIGPEKSISFLASRMPKLLKALAKCGLEKTNPDLWVPALKTQTCLAAFRTPFFGRDQFIEIDTPAPQSPLELRLSFARMEEEQIRAALSSLPASETAEFARYIL